MAEFSTILSRYVERIYIMKSPLFGSQEESPSPKRLGHSYFCIICLFVCYLFVFTRDKIMRRAKSAMTYFSANCLPSAFSVRRLTVGRLSLASTQHPTSADDHRLQLVGPPAEVTYKFCYLSELLHSINFALMLSLLLI